MFPIASIVVTKPYEAMRMLAPEALLQEMRSGVALTILDVRDRARVRETGVITGARSIPLEQLGSRVDELTNLRATVIVVVSQRARRARAAVLELQAAGFAEVLLLEGGMGRWMELGYPIEERDGTPSVRP